MVIKTAGKINTSHSCATPYNWKEHFTVEKSDKNGDLFCDSAEGILRAVAAADNNIDVDGLFEKDSKRRITSNEFLKAYKNDTDYKPVALGLRRLVCRHPLEWDAELYRNECEYYPQEMCKARHDCRYASMKREVMGKADVWNEADVLEKREEKMLWHIHPIKLGEHLDKMRLDNTRAGILKYVQDEVLALKCLEKNKEGMYGIGGYTFCNHAVFLTVIATDGNYRNFTNKNTEAFPDVEKTKQNEYENENNIKSSNFWCDVLERMVGEGRLVRLSSPEDAQMYGNMGFTVVASYRAIAEKDWHPHFATVRPGFDCHDTKGPRVANVGMNNTVEWAGSDECFGIEKLSTTKWYYNPNQEFRCYMDMIEEVRSNYG